VEWEVVYIRCTSVELDSLVKAQRKRVLDYKAVRNLNHSRETIIKMFLSYCNHEALDRESRATQKLVDKYGDEPKEGLVFINLAAAGAAALIGFLGPISAIGSILAGIDYGGLDHMMMVACGGLLPSFWKVIKRAVKLERKKGSVGMVMGVACAVVCLTFTRLVCLHTTCCNSAAEAVR
ncbi:unnamed protein product, partial [Brassica oleracea]